ncbi:MAG TPA: phenylacetate--CoA ligase family protein [Actinomycetota bacterium]|jgi:phenylacetate-coenzyme A ligase PaaK-like adenylate-forming protein|nr:phenylacetate--CoA ligase family protein [Actinomycetota bacterium]
MTPTPQRKRLADIAGAMRLARELIAHDTWTTEQLQALQRRRLTELVRHATTSSPFYRERYAGLDPGDPVELARLPVVDKATVMERFDDLVCDRRLTLAAVEAHLDGLTRDELLLGRYRAMATGGSTGRKGVFVADRAEWRQYLAGFFRWNHYIGLRPRLPRRLRIASVAAARPLHMTYRMAASIDVGLYRVLRLEAAMPAAAMVQALNRHQPEFLYAYGSVLGLLAAEQRDGRLRIGPAVIASSGETHTEELREAIRAAWGTSSFELYAMTEAGIVGSHCDRHTGIHLFEDQAIVEVVDERGRPVPDGQLGHKLLVTNLVNRTQPLLRYEVSDMVAMAPEPCPCGRPFRLLRGIEGRNDDILHLPAAAGGTVAVHPLALRGALAGIPGLAQYKVVHDHDGLHVRAALRPGAASVDTAQVISTRLTGKLAAQGVAGLAVQVELRDSLQDERDTAGKFKLVESRVGRPAPAGR